MSDSLIICVSDYWRRCHYHNRQNREAGDAWPEAKPLRRLCIDVDAINGNYYLREFLHQHVLAQSLMHNHGVQLVWLQFEEPEKHTIDYKFADMLAHTLWERIEVEHLMSWLSTLGGGFSALGEQFERCVSNPSILPTWFIPPINPLSGENGWQDFAAAVKDWHATR